MLEPISSPLPLFKNPQHDPQFSLNVKTRDGRTLAVADPRATRALVSLMDMYAVLGGAASHFGGPSALAELMSTVHAFMFDFAKTTKRDWQDLFLFANDAGHCENGLYALKANYGLAGLTLDSLRGFRSVQSVLTGHGEAHLFPEGVYLSNGPLGSAFPQTQGLALGESWSGRNRTVVSVISDGACMEGEAKEALAAIPGLAQKGLMSPYILIISDNNTKLTGRIDKDSFSMAPTFASLEGLGWEVVTLQNGHDLQACLAAIEDAYEKALKNPKKPVAIHAKTIKGYGVKKTADSESGGHGFPLKKPAELKEFLREIYSGEAYPSLFDTWIEDLGRLESEINLHKVPDTGEKIQVSVAKAMSLARKSGLPIVSITSDLPGSTGVASFRKEFPEASVDVGVAEANMISTAAGLSKLGFIPVVDTFAQFGVTKGALPITMANLSQAPVICIFSHTGFQDAADGASHQALSYLAMTASIPHTEVYQLSCSAEAESLVTEAIHEFAHKKRRGEVPPTYIFFLGRENFPQTFPNAGRITLRSAQITVDTSAQFASSWTLVTSGSLLQEAYLAADLLAKRNLGCVIVNHPYNSAVDAGVVSEALSKSKGKVVVFEDHQAIGGFGERLGHFLAVQGLSVAGHTPRLLSLGVKGEFGQSAYTSADLYEKHGLSAAKIVEQIVRAES